MALPIETKKVRDKDGNRALKSDTCQFFCIKYSRGVPSPCDLYLIKESREWCKVDEECQE